MQVAEKLKAPIVTTLRGREYVEYDNPYDVGLTGLIGYSSGYHAMMGCETLLMLGTDFPYTQFYPEKATVIQVDRRGENLGRRTRLDLGLIGDVKATLDALLGALETKTTIGISENSWTIIMRSAKAWTSWRWDIRAGNRSTRSMSRG